MPAPLTKFLLVATCTAILVGGWLGYQELPTHFEPRPNHPGWVRRYSSLSESLVDERRVFFVQEQETGGSHRYFRAQFVLLPVILHRRPTIDSLKPRQIEDSPLILDFYSRKGLREALRSLQTTANKAGFDLDVVRGRGHLAVVRARRIDRAQR